MNIDKLLESNLDSWLSGAYDVAPDFTLFVDQAGKIVYANPQSVAVIGYTPSEICQLPVELLIPERYRTAHLSHMQAYFANPRLRPMGRDLDLMVLHKDGTELPVEISLSPISTAQRDLVICTIRDISNRKKIATAFLGDERFRLFMKHTPSAVAMFDTQMHYLAVSRRWLEDYQLTDKHLIGLSHYEVFPETPELWKAIHLRCLSGETLEAQEELFLHQADEKDWVSWKMHPWHLESGEIGGAILFTEIITARKNAEQALRKSQERYQSIFENAVSGIAITDLAGRFQMANPAYCKLLGYSHAELYQQSLAAIIHPDDQQANQALITQLLNHHIPYFEIENRLIRKDKQVVWVHKFVAILSDGIGNATQIQELVTDITARKAADEALRNSEALNNSILNSMNSHIAVLDGCGVIVAVNNAWRQFAKANGLTEKNEPVLGVNYLDVCKKGLDYPYGEEASTAYAGITNVLTGKWKTFNLEYACHAPDEQHWFMMKVTPLMGTYHGVVVIHENITERKKAEAILNSIFNAAVDGIISFDQTGTIISANAAVETIFGYEPIELLDQNISKLKLSENVLQFNKMGSGQIQEVKGVSKTGDTVPLDISRAEYEIDNQLFYTIIVRDISQRKLREKLDKTHLDELAHVTRLGLMGEMASGIAHEINQPLSAISSFSQAIINVVHAEQADLVMLAEIAHKTQQQALRAGQIIHRMREFVKYGTKHRSTVDINNTIQEAINLCSPTIKQNYIHLSFDLDSNLPPVNADHIQIEQVLINLIRNSIDVLKSLPEMQHRDLSIHSHLTANHQIEVRVKDNGPGMDTEQQQKILTPFYTTKADGMGMGLSICRSLIEAHKGELRFNSKPGKGTTFYFTLPVDFDGITKLD